MLKIHDNKKHTTCPWSNGNIPDYDNFRFSKTENFDFDEYFYVTRSKNGCLTAEITKNKGEKVTEEDLNKAFATSLVVAMAGFDFNQETAQNYFAALPLEFYTKETFDLVCEKMENVIEQSPKFEKSRLERNIFLFQDFAHKANEEEIPAPKPLHEEGKNL